MATHIGGKKRVPSGGNAGKKGPFLCLLRVELLGVSPSIWRKLWVSNIMTLAHLHHILQAAMGWTDAHLHQFTIEGVRYGPPDPEDDDFLVDERKTRLGKVLAPGLSFEYQYDFGDNWIHRLTVNKIIPVEDPRTYAYVESGKGACPPEDCGGPYQYQRFLSRWKQNRESPEVLSFLEWAGSDFDPGLFPRHAINASLMRMAWNGWVLPR